MISNTISASLCCVCIVVVMISWLSGLIYPYSSGLFYLHCYSLMNTNEATLNDMGKIDYNQYSNSQQGTTNKLCAYLLGHTVCRLTHWGRVTHICVGNLTIIGLDNGLSPGRRQAITWTNVGILLIGPLGTNFSEMLIKIHTFSFKKIRLKISSGKWRPFCLSLNVLTYCGPVIPCGVVELNHHWFSWLFII